MTLTTKGSVPDVTAASEFTEVQYRKWIAQLPGDLAQAVIDREQAAFERGRAYGIHQASSLARDEAVEGRRG